MTKNIKSHDVLYYDKVYRYLSADYALMALQTGRLKVGRLFELNDPFDCAPHLKDEHSHSLLETIAEQVGVICYSSKIDDPVVWSHYGNSHRGVALAFRFKKGDGLALHKVEYPEDEKRASYDTRKLRQAMESEKSKLNFIREAFGTKAKSWTYEAESRHMVELHKCKMVGRHYFFPFPKYALTEVILGARCDISTADIYNIIHGANNEEDRKYGDVIPRRVSLNKSSFRLNIK